MESFIDQCARIIEEHQVWAGPIVGLLAFGESMVLIGILLPGTAILVIVGGFVGAGLLDPVPVLVGAIAGAAFGDLVSYFVGRWLGRGIVHKWPLNRYRRASARARLFFRRYGIAAVFLGRFFGPVRSAIPLVAGMMGMNLGRFQVANILSAIVWAPVVLSPGWLVARGASTWIELSDADSIGLAAVAIAVAIVGAYVAVKLFRRSGLRQARPVRPPAE